MMVIEWEKVDTASLKAGDVFKHIDYTGHGHTEEIRVEKVEGDRHGYEWHVDGTITTGCEAGYAWEAYYSNLDKNEVLLKVELEDED